MQTLLYYTASHFALHGYLQEETAAAAAARPLLVKWQTISVGM